MLKIVIGFSEPVRQGNLLKGVKMQKMVRIFSFIVILVLPGMLWATSGPQSPHPGNHRRPPQAAFDVCMNKSEGTQVEISTPDGNIIKATCKKLEGQLVAVPEGAPPAPPSGTR